MKKCYWILIMILCIILAPFVYKGICESIEREKKQSEFDAMICEIQQFAQNDLPTLTKEEVQVKDIVCSYSSRIECSSAAKVYRWYPKLTATIYVNDELDTMEEDQQYEYICSLGRTVKSLFRDYVTDRFPDYDYCAGKNGILTDLYEYITCFDEYEITIKTSKNIYEYSPLGYYIKNGRKEHYNYEPWDPNEFLEDDNGKCALSHCDHTAKEGKPYCGRHACCEDGCKNQKDPAVHCCNIHNCQHPGCGMHRYEYIGSKYCQVHYDEH